MASFSKPSSVDKKSPLDDDFTKIVEGVTNDWHVPGIAIGVIDDEITFSSGYGVASYPSEPVTANTLFYTGSTTKAFVAAAMGLLINESSSTTDPIKWDTPMCHILREDFVLSDEHATNHVTIEDALSHRASLPAHYLSYGGEKSTVQDVVRGMRDLPMHQELRTRWIYCNTMYVAIGHAIEKITGQWLGDVLRTRIWEPLGMSNTFFSHEDATKHAKQNPEISLARGYIWSQGKQVEVPYLRLTEIAGAGAMISNVNDYLKWLECLKSHTDPISEKLYNDLIAPRSIVTSNEPPFVGPQTHALGWNISVYQNELVMSHQGGLDGFGTCLTYLPKRKFGVITIGNSPYTSNIAGTILTYRLIDDRLGVPKEERFDWNAKYQKDINDREEAVAQARSELYPNVPKEAPPTTIPLKEFVGTYNHPGYQTISITHNDVKGKLEIDARNRTWGFTGDLEHVSGDHFIAYIWRRTQSTRPVATGRAEFRVGADGKASEVGIELEPGMKDFKIWFKKI